MSNHKRKGTKYDKCFGSDPEKYEPYVSPIKAKEIKKKYHKYYDKFDRSEIVPSHVLNYFRNSGPIGNYQYKRIETGAFTDNTDPRTCDIRLQRYQLEVYNEIKK